MRRRHLWIAPFVVVALVATGCGGSAGPATAGAAGRNAPYVVLVVSPLSGSLSTIGQGVVNGIRAAAAVVNSHGGILGRKVRVETLNDNGDPSTAASLVSQRVSSGTKPDLVVPGVNSAEAVAIVPITTAAGVLSMGTPNASSLNNPHKYPYEFPTAPNDLLPAEQLMQYFSASGVKKLAVLSSTDASGASTLAATQQAAARAHITVASATYNDTDLDVTAQLQQLQAAKPQALYFEGVGTPVGVFLQDRSKLGWNIPTVCDLDASVTPIMSTAVVGTPEVRNVKMQVLGLQVYTPPAHRPAALTAFFGSLSHQGPVTVPVTVYSFGYDTLILAALAARQAKSASAAAMANALIHLKAPAAPYWVTLKGYRYTAASHQPATSLSSWTEIAPAHLTDGQYNRSAP
jgi:branched-chain amino acid transport system substrate-binding protein